MIHSKKGIDYEETFSPVAMLKSIRILLAVAAKLDYEIWQMDVKTAVDTSFCPSLKTKALQLPLLCLYKES